MIFVKTFIVLVLVQGFLTYPMENSPISFKGSLGRVQNNNTENCEKILDADLVKTIAGYQETANKIMDLLVNGSFKGQTYKELADLVDVYPRRLSGSKSLEDSIDYMIERMKQLGIENVRGEQVEVPHWIRGEEKATLLQPVQKSLALLGLGTSVGTPEDGITASVLVVRSFEELDEKKDQVPGKIVVFNQGWNGSYGATNDYRGYGASHAAQYGAVAALIQSIAPFSLNTPHTGLQMYLENVTHIPAACITMEDADYLYRLHERSNDLIINLKMLDYNLPLTTSRNVIGELRGSKTPEEYVALSGHIDSWDVGQGAMDDGGGVMISVMALAALKHLGLTPNRTLQAILWTSEEFKLYGVEGFVKQHKNMLANYSVAFESDYGTFKPKGLDFWGTEEAGCIVNEVLKLVKPIDATEYNKYEEFVGSDISLLSAEGVPGLNFNNENDNYFWWHHSEADTLSMMNSTHLDLGTALFAVTSYVLADIPVKLPRDEGAH